MKHIKFNKTICGVDFLLNVLDCNSANLSSLDQELQTTDFFQIIFINKVEGTLLLDDKIIQLRDQSVIFISKHQQHQWRIDTDTFDAQILVFQEDFLNEFFADQYFTYRLLYFYQTTYSLELPIATEELKRYLINLNEIKQEIITPANDSVHLIRSLLYYILIRLNRSYSNFNKITLALSVDNIAYQFRKLVEENITTKQRVEEYALLMKLSRVALNKAVKKQFHITATDLIKSKLMYEIKMKLLYTNMTVNEIAQFFNFSESNHLTRLFKNKEGITPNEYRSSKILDD